MTMTTDLSDLHQAIEQLPESALPKLTRFIRALLAETRDKQANMVESLQEVEPSPISYAELTEREELNGWLKLAESSYSFWDNEKDAAYDAL